MISYQSPQANTEVPSNLNLTNAKCNLLNWTATGQVVARAEIASTDPTSKVHHIVLGPDCYKVWIKEILVPEVPLFRSSREHFFLDDAIGSTVAWPHKYISFD